MAKTRIMENKLISMTKFVLNQESKFKQMNKKDYAKFLDQPLTLGMFVPVYENGNVYNEPFEEYGEKLTKYFEAKEKVLFKGFEMYDILFLNNDLEIAYNVEEIEHWDIEILEAIHSHKIELTQSALNQIGLKTN